MSIVSQLGLTMAGCILFCLYIGHLLDKWIGTKPLFTTIFIILGIIGGGVTAYRQIEKVLDQNKKDDEPGPENKNNG